MSGWNSSSKGSKETGATQVTNCNVREGLWARKSSEEVHDARLKLRVATVTRLKEADPGIGCPGGRYLSKCPTLCCREIWETERFLALVSSPVAK